MTQKLVANASGGGKLIWCTPLGVEMPFTKESGFSGVSSTELPAVEPAGVTLNQIKIDPGVKSTWSDVLRSAANMGQSKRDVGVGGIGTVHATITKGNEPVTAIPPKPAESEDQARTVIDALCLGLRLAGENRYAEDEEKFNKALSAFTAMSYERGLYTRENELMRMDVERLRNEVNTLKGRLSK